MLSSFAARHVCLSVAIILCPLRAHACMRVCVFGLSASAAAIVVVVVEDVWGFSSLHAFTAAKSPEDELQDLTACVVRRCFLLIAECLCVRKQL